MAFGAAELQILLKARDDTGRALKSSERGIQQFAKVAKFALLGLGVAAAGVGVAVVKMAADFEKGMAEVRTLMPDISAETFGKLQEDVLAFSKDVGVATDKVIPALYQAISAGVPPDNVLEFMGIAARASIGGVTELETAVDGITSVVNSYGREVLSAQEAADIMFTGVRLGKTNFNELSRSLFNVVPIAKELGIGFDEVVAQLAMITAQGVPTTVATTTLRQAFVEASKSGTILDKAIRELHGVGMAGLIERGMSATEVLQSVREATERAGVPFQDLFSSVEAANAALQITGDNFDKVQSAMGDMANSAGAVDAAFETMADTASFKFGKIMIQLKAQGIEFGLVILPAVTMALGALTKALEITTVLVEGLVKGLKNIFNIENLKGAAKGWVNIFIFAFNALIKAWNALEFKTPAFNIGPVKVPSVTIGTPDVPEIPMFDRGGTVPGPIGSPQLIRAHGGERVLRIGESGGGDGNTFVFNNFVGDRRAAQEWVLETLVMLERRGSLKGVTA